MPGATVKGACGFLRTGSLSRAVRVSSLVERGRRAMIYLRCLGSVQAMGVEAVGTLWKMIERFSVSSRSCHKRLEGSGIAWKALQGHAACAQRPRRRAHRDDDVAHSARAPART